MKLLLASLLAAAVSTMQAAAPQEIMLLTSWDGALERFWRNDRTSGVRFGGKNPADSNQKWLVDTSANSIRTSDNFCVTAAWSPGQAFPNDLIVLLTSCNGGDYQRWVYSNGDHTFQVTLRGSQGSRTYCLDADKATGSTIHGWSCSPSNAPNANQQWTLFYPGYQIKAGGKCLALGQANHEDEPIRLADCDNNPLQMWKYDFDEAGRAWCFGGACGAAFDTIVKFYDIERSVCEIHYPERKEDVISGHIYAIDCLILSESLPAGFRAERDARVAKARSAIGATTAPTTTAPTTAPPTTAPPTTPPPTTPPPTTAAPTTPAPEPTATPGPSVVAIQNVTQSTAGSASSASSGADTSESSAVVSPPPTSKTAPAPVPSSAKPATSSATNQYGAVGTAVAVALLLAAN